MNLVCDRKQNQAKTERETIKGYPIGCGISEKRGPRWPSLVRLP